MSKKMIRTEIPNAMFDQVKASIDAGKFSTLSDFVRTAIREQIRREGSL